MTHWDKLVEELGYNGITVQKDGGVLLKGQSPMPVADAIRYVRANAQKNAELLLDLWQNIPSLEGRGSRPSNSAIQKLFVSAVKHMVNVANNSRVLRANRLPQRLGGVLLKDIRQFSQTEMSDFVDYRLAIDWLDHLVSYDDYRAELLEALSMGPQALQKEAQGYGRNLDYPEERSTSWSLYKDRLMKNRMDVPPATEEKSSWEREEERRSEEGYENSEQSQHGFLDDYEEVKDGVKFYRRGRKGTMLDLFENNQKWMDHSGDAERLGHPEDAGPLSQRSQIMGR